MFLFWKIAAEARFSIALKTGELTLRSGGKEPPVAMGYEVDYLR